MKRSFPLAVVLVLAQAPRVPAQNVAVVYYSMTGHTQSMAEAVATGARSVSGADVRLLRVDEAGSDDLLWADAIIIGSPVHNANVSVPVLEYMMTWPFEGQPLAGKIGAAFVTGGGISAGEEAVQLSILRAMLVYNMIVMGGPDWHTAFGASAVTGEEPFNAGEPGTVDPLFLAKGEALGRWVAEIAARIAG